RGEVDLRRLLGELELPVLLRLEDGDARLGRAVLLVEAVGQGGLILRIDLPEIDRPRDEVAVAGDLHDAGRTVGDGLDAGNRNGDLAATARAGRARRLLRLADDRRRLRVRVAHAQRHDRGEPEQG